MGGDPVRRTSLGLTVPVGFTVPGHPTERLTTWRALLMYPPHPPPHDGLPMPALRNADSAVIDPRKLLDYILDPTNPQGRHKARVFKRALGCDRSNHLGVAEAYLVEFVNDDGSTRALAELTPEKLAPA